MNRRQFLSCQAGVGAGLITAAANPLAPLPFSIEKESGLVFLFQGDSITDGNRGRSPDPNHVMGHGYAYGVASRVGADFPERDFVFYNRGISGNKVTDLQKRWQTDTLDLKPDVLSLLVGINDTNAFVKQDSEATTPAQFETIYRQLLTDCRKQNPDILLVLGLPFVYAGSRTQGDLDRWQADLAQRQTGIRQLAGEFDAVLIDYSAVLDQAIKHKTIDYWIWDGVHPTVFAHELMTRAWLKQVSSRLRFLKKYK